MHFLQQAAVVIGLRMCLVGRLMVSLCPVPRYLLTGPFFSVYPVVFPTLPAAGMSPRRSRPIAFICPSHKKYCTGYPFPCIFRDNDYITNRSVLPNRIMPNHRKILFQIAEHDFLITFVRVNTLIYGWLQT